MKSSNHTVENEPHSGASPFDKLCSERNKKSFDFLPLHRFHRGIFEERAKRFGVFVIHVTTIAYVDSNAILK